MSRRFCETWEAETPGRPGIKSGATENRRAASLAISLYDCFCMVKVVLVSCCLSVY